MSGLSPFGLLEAGYLAMEARTGSEGLEQGGDQGGRQGSEQEGVEDAVADLLDEVGSFHGVHCRSPLVLSEGCFHPSFVVPLH